QYATLLGKSADAEMYGKQAAALETAFNARFLNREKNIYDNGTATSSALPLAFGMVPAEVREKVFAQLVDKILQENNGHISTGLVGGQWLNRVLSDHGRPDVVYTMASQRTFPSWGYMIDQKATTIWELWNGDTANPEMNSMNHVMLVGDLGIWMHEYLGGIRPDSKRPGFKQVVFRPEIVGDISYVKSSHEGPYGLIRSDWTINNGQLEWNIRVPANSRGAVIVPVNSPDLVHAPEGATFLKVEDGRCVYAVGSGRHYFEAKWPSSK
ncbi:MAG: alpha-L-rhamnosidase C-terminal domain-containing protein, partial [Tepidisphaeraceae bacterium]